MSHVFALVDCVNFYASCERLFEPSLRGHPVAVLSNNDGCIIARSEELKRLGVPRGAPYFQYHEMLQEQDVRVFSSNYTLYADLSRRVMEVLRREAAALEVYSIDEAFLHLPDADHTALMNTAGQIQRRVHQYTGIPIRVGIAPTKTLAKAASTLAKRHGNVFCLAHHPQESALLDEVPASDVWGIGRSYRKLLKKQQIATARALRELPDRWVRRHMRVVGLRTVWELRGQSCLPLEQAPPARHSITRSRSFGRPVREQATLYEAVATFTSRASEKLRSYGLVASVLQVFVTTGRHASGPSYTNTCTLRLPQPTHYTPHLLEAARAAVEQLYRPGYAFRKASVTLLELSAEHPAQGHLFLQPDPQQRTLMQTLDAINQRYGAGTLRYASTVPPLSTDAGEAAQDGWQPRCQHRSPCYTTDWNDVPTVYAR